MESSTDGEEVTLNANRNVAPEAGAAAAAPSASRAAAPAAPPVVVSFDWKKLLPWLLGLVLLILIVWLLTQKRGGGVPAA